MKTQGVNVKSMSFMDLKSPSTGSASKSSADFGKVMNKAAVNTSNNDTKDNKWLNIKNSDKINLKSDQTASKVDVSDENETVSSDTTQETIPLDFYSVIQNANLTESDLDAMTDKIADVVKDALNLTDDQLNQLLDKMGIQMIQLLNPETCKEIVMQSNNVTDKSLFLTDESMLNQLNQLKTGLDALNLEKDFGITKEQLQSLVEQIGNKGNINNTFIQTEQNNETDDFNTVLDNSQTSNDQKIVVIKETDSSDSDKGSTKSSDGDKDEKSILTQKNESNPMHVFIENLTHAVSKGTQSVEATRQLMTEITEQVVNQIKVIVKPDTTSMEMQLNPESLGKVNLLVAVKNGMTTATFTVQNDIAKEALESQMQILKDNLQQQGLKVESVEVNVSEFGFAQKEFEQQNEQEKKGSSKKFKWMDEDSEISTDEISNETESAKVSSNSQVDYTV